MPTPEELQQMWEEEASATSAPDQSAEETPPNDEASSVAGQAAEVPAEDATETALAVDPLQQRLEELTATNNQLLERMRKTEGHIGGLTSELNRTKEKLAAGITSSQSSMVAPTDTQMAAAAQNPEKWERLKEDFPEWADGVAAYLDSRLPAKGGVDQEQINSLVNERVQQQVTTIEAGFNKRLVELEVELSHKGWKDTINKPAFSEWAQHQAPEVMKLFYSDVPADAIRMLDLYQEATKAKSATDVQQTRQTRLRDSILPNGTNAHAQKGPEAMTAQELWNLEASRRQQQ